MCTTEYSSGIKKKPAVKPQKDGGILNIYCLVKEASLKRLHVLYFIIPTVWHSGKGKTKERIKKISGFQTSGERGAE